MAADGWPGLAVTTYPPGVTHVASGLMVLGCPDLVTARWAALALAADGLDWSIPMPYHFKQWGPRNAGRTLDGRVHDEVPGAGPDRCTAGQSKIDRK